MRRWLVVGVASLGLGFGLGTVGCGDDAVTSSLIDQDARRIPNLDAAGSGADALAVADSSAPTEDGAVPVDAAPTADAVPEQDTATPEDAAVVLDTLTAADTTLPADTVEPADTAPAADTVVAQDTTTPPADTVVAQDTTTPPADTATVADTTEPSGCTLSCPAAGHGPTGLTLTLRGAMAQAPTLTGLAGGSPAPAGLYELTAVDIYRFNAFSSMVSVNIVDNYNASTGAGTNGTAHFAQGIWSVFLDLDLLFHASAFGQNLDQAVQQEVFGGGCYTLVGNLLESDLGYCAGGWPDGVERPAAAEFSYNDASGRLALKLTFARAFLLAQLPADMQALGSFVITGDLVLVLTLDAVE